MGWLWALLPKILPIILGLFGGGKDKTLDNARELGRAEQQNADSKADIATIAKANTAAKKVEQEETANDPNDRDNRP